MDKSPGKQLIVSIHDVRPRLFPQVETMLATLKQVGVPITSLLVIPNFHREEPLENYPQMIEKLKTLAAASHEIVLHALYHQEEPPKEGQNFMQYIISRHYTNGEGEFYRLSYDEARDRLQKGLALFQKLNLPTSGFTAPAWLYSNASRQAIANLKLQYYTTLWGIEQLGANPRHISARAVVWSHRAAWRRLSSNAFLPWIAARIIKSGGPLRVALHPPDFSFDSIRKCALEIIDRALRHDYQPITYLQCVDRGSVALQPTLLSSQP